MRFLILLLIQLQDPEALLRELGDADLGVRERATRRLLDGFRSHRAAIEKRLREGTDAETAARLRDILRRGPAWADRRELEAKLGSDFATRNGEHLKGLFGDEKDAFLRATDRLFRENPNQDRELKLDLARRAWLDWAK